MTHEHAFHTSCREGMTGRPGFQFNAASAGLSDAQLQGLARAHAGYHAPRDLPAQPEAAQLARFPIAFKHAIVDGVGPSLSRTVYVGREFRGRDGAPDTGRFGNYFSHIVVGHDQSPPFDELLPIELWDAAHWQDVESPTRALQPIAGLTPGPLTLDRTLADLGADRLAWIPQFIDAVLRALTGGPRVVLLDEPNDVAAAWIALASFSLPRSLAMELTFSTFEGNPRTARMHVCATTSGCDAGFEPHELGRSVVVFDIAGARPQPQSSGLLGRVVRALAADGAEALSSAARAAFAGRFADPEAHAQRFDAQDRTPAEPDDTPGNLDRTIDDPDRCEDELALGARLALAAARAAPARDDRERAAVLHAAARHLRMGGRDIDLGTALRHLGTVDVPGREELRGWLGLHAVARMDPDRGASAATVDAALDVLIPLAERVGGPEGEQLTPLSSASPTEAPVQRLVMWLDSLTTQRPDSLAARARGGWRLGLIGANRELDRDLAAALAAAIERPDVQALLAELGADPQAIEVSVQVAHWLADRCVEQPQAMDALGAIAATHPAIRRRVVDRARSTEAFPARLAAAVLCLRDEPAQRAMLVRQLAALASSPAEQAAIRALYERVERPEQVTEIVRCYLESSGRVPAIELACCRRALSGVSLSDPEARQQAAMMARLLVRADPEAARWGEYTGWYLASHPPGAGGPSLTTWVKWLCQAARRPPQELPDERLQELMEIAARAVFQADEEEHVRAFDALATAFNPDLWARLCSRELARELEHHRDPARRVAGLFSVWWTAEAANSSIRLMSTGVLAEALERWPARRREEVRDALPQSYQREWERWCDEHPPSSALHRTIGRLAGRRERP